MFLEEGERVFPFVPFFFLIENFRNPAGQKGKRSGVGSSFDPMKALLILQSAF
jgi:hypothetical protein